MSSSVADRSASPIASVLRLLFGLLPLVALIRQLMVHLSLGFNAINFFSYYTNLSNLVAGSVLLLSAFPIKLFSDGTMETLRVIAVINMTLVGLVFAILLRHSDVGALLPWVNFVHHYLMPCIILIDWIAIPPRIFVGPQKFTISLVFPLAYLVYSLVRGKLTGWYPYPFLNAASVDGILGVAAYVVGITLAFCVVGLALIALGNRRRQRLIRALPSRA